MGFAGLNSRRGTFAGLGAFGALYPGDRGEAVRRLQIALNDAFFYLGENISIAEDGDYGPRTQDAVTRFQQAVGIPVSGRAYDMTLRALGLPENLSTTNAGSGTGGGVDPYAEIARQQAQAESERNRYRAGAGTADAGAAARVTLTGGGFSLLSPVTAVVAITAQTVTGAQEVYRVGADKAQALINSLERAGKRITNIAPDTSALGGIEKFLRDMMTSLGFGAALGSGAVLAIGALIAYGIFKKR